MGSAKGYLNWQGILNSAFRLRGESIFVDMVETPSRAHRLFDVVATVMVEAARMFYERQRRYGWMFAWISTGNCMLNMISPRHYREILLSYDLRLREAFEGFGVTIAPGPWIRTCRPTRRSPASGISTWD